MGIYDSRTHSPSLLAWSEGKPSDDGTIQESLANAK